MDDFAIYNAARDLGKENFKVALQGLLAGHQDSLDEMKKILADKDMAFLMALSLTEKGKRLDKDGVMEQAIAKGLRGLSHCEIEKKFVERVDQKEKKPTVVSRLKEYYSLDEIGKWLATPHPQLDDEIPLEIMPDPEGQKRVHAVIDRMDSYGYL